RERGRAPDVDLVRDRGAAAQTEVALHVQAAAERRVVRIPEVAAGGIVRAVDEDVVVDVVDELLRVDGVEGNAGRRSPGHVLSAGGISQTAGRGDEPAAEVSGTARVRLRVVERPRPGHRAAVVARRRGWQETCV